GLSTLSLHDALPISTSDAVKKTNRVEEFSAFTVGRISDPVTPGIELSRIAMSGARFRIASTQPGASLQDATILKSEWAPSTLLRSEEHTSELQSRSE